MNDDDVSQLDAPTTRPAGAVPGFAERAPIARQSLHDLVANRLRDLIIEGVLAPGDRLNEVGLCEDLGVSRTPLREAIKTLVGEGLVDSRPGRGNFVRKFSPEDVHGMLEVLAELEGLAGRLACERAGDAAIAAIVKIHEEMLGYYRTGERLPYYKLNQQIHSLIAAASGNRTLIEMHDNIQARMKRLRFIGNSGPEKWRDAVAEHEEMIVALKNRDAAALSEVLHRHMRNTWTRVRDSI